MTTPSTLAKKTKADLIDEYQNLLQRFDELKNDSRSAFSQPSLLSVQKAKTHTTENVVQAISQLKTNINQQLSDFSNTFHTHINAILGDLLNEVKKFDDLQQAIETSRQTLDIQHHITVAAETMEHLVSEAEEKKKKMETEYAEMRAALESKMQADRRAWEREHEEHEYGFAIKRKRDHEAWETERAKREEVLHGRESAFQEAKRGLDEREKQITVTQENMTKDLAQREKEIEKRFQQEYATRFDHAKREWEGERKMLELQMQIREDDSKRLQSELVLLRKESEAAQKKAQELAIRVIESSAPKAPQPDTGTRGQT